MKINKKIYGIPLFAILGIALVSAVLTYYAFFSITLNVNQPMGVTYTGDLKQSIPCNAGEVCFGDAIQLENTGDVDKSVFITDVSPLGIDVGYVGKMIFAGKDLETGVVSEDTKEIFYTVTGDTFVVTGIPSGYDLIYYPDMDGGFSENVQNILVYGENDFSSLPVSEDIGDDYCNILTRDESELANPDALVCNGAKLWLVENTYTDALKLGTWTPSSILFETDLITYTQSSTGEVLVPADSTIIVYPQYTINEHIVGGEKTVLLTIA